MDVVSRKAFLQAVASLLALVVLGPALPEVESAVETEAVSILPFSPYPCLRDGDTLTVAWTVNF